MTHVIVLTKPVYERSAVKKILNELESIHNLDIEVRYGTPKSNRQRKSNVPKK